MSGKKIDPSDIPEAPPTARSENENAALNPKGADEENQSPESNLDDQKENPEDKSKDEKKKGSMFACFKKKDDKKEEENEMEKTEEEK
jgi:hypothetical protein